MLFASRIEPSQHDPAPGAAAATVDGLTVALAATPAAAGPVALTVDVHDADGAPVAGATVTISARSAEMNMDTVEMAAAETESGRYVASDVALGMGGAWNIAVAIAVPGRDPLTAQLAITLTGP